MHIYDIQCIHYKTISCKIPIISPGFFVGLFSGSLFFCWAYFRGNLFSEGLVIGRNFACQNEFGLSIKTAQNTEITA